MLIEYLPILIYGAIAVVFALFAIVASALLGQRKPTALKQAPYECGMTTIGSSFGRIPIKYYIIAINGFGMNRVAPKLSTSAIVSGVG